MIVVFGSVNLDLVARVPRIPAPGETVAGTAFETAPGGKGANQALAARQAGAEVALFGAVGHDDFARIAMANLVAAGVDVEGVRHADAATGVALIDVDARGENAITVVAGANAYARADQVPAALLRPRSTVLMQLETPMREVEALAARARDAGARVVLNAAPASPFPDKLLRNVDVLVVNEHEAAACAAALALSALPEAFLRGMRERFGVAAVITLGSRGAITLVDGKLVSEASPAVDVVDTTGAGDAFCGALAAALERGESLAASMAAGVRAGALACTHAGAQRVAQAGKAHAGKRLK
jgi:ribokinase